MSEESSQDVTSLTVQLLSAYLANNTVASEDLASLIATTRTALSAPASVDEPAAEQTYEPAVSLRKSLSSRDHIISLIDGKPYKMLKRHLLGHGLTPADYRVRYNLPADYPMVAPAYSDQRREVAKNLGLGRKATTAVETPELPVEPAEDVAKPVAKASRKTKAPADAVVTPVVTGSEASDLGKPGKVAKPAKAPSKASKTVTAKAEKLTAVPLNDEAASVVPAPDAPEPATPAAKPKRARAPKAAVAKSSVESSARVAKKDKAPKPPRVAKAVDDAPAPDATPAEEVSKPAAKRSKPKAEADPTSVTKVARPRRTARAPEEASEVPA